LDAGFVVESLRLSPDGKTLALAGSHTAVRFLDVASETLGEPQSLDRDTMLYEPRFLDDRHVLLLGSDGKLRQWDSRTGKAVRTFEGATEHSKAFDLSPDGRHAVTVGVKQEGNVFTGGSTQVWDVKAGKPVRTFRH